MATEQTAARSTAMQVWERGGVVYFGTAEDHDTLTPDEADAKAPALINQGNQHGIAIAQQMNDLRSLMEALEVQYRQAQRVAGLGTELIMAAAQAREKAKG